MSKFTDEDHAVARKLTDQKFPSRAGVMSTHWEDCYKQHPECAYYISVLETIHETKATAP